MSYDPVKKDGYMEDEPPKDIVESFRWLTSEFKKQRSQSRNSVYLKIIGARAGDISLNKRKYVEPELMKSARTFIGRPITINHDPDMKVGTIKTADYEDGRLELLGEVTQEPWLSHIRHKDPVFSGVSIEANYRYNVCPHCGERFETDQEFYDHLERVHLIKGGDVREPHGMIGMGLSLVTKDEQPGIPTAGFELMEMAVGLNKLYEMMSKEKGFALKKSEKRKPAIEQDKKEPCPEGEHRDAEGNCVPDEKPLGEPFAGYKDFADCVSKNSDKKDPEAYCATIMRQVELATETVITELFVKGWNAFVGQTNPVLKHYGGCIDHLEERMDALEAKGLKETATVDKSIEKRLTEVENLLDKQRGSFKGHQPSKAETEEYSGDPLKEEE